MAEDNRVNSAADTRDAVRVSLILELRYPAVSPSATEGTAFSTPRAAPIASGQIAWYASRISSMVEPVVRARDKQKETDVLAMPPSELQGSLKK